MNNIRNFYKKMIPNIFLSNKQDNIFVGRWIIPNNNNNYSDNINLIIDRNNEDHCGACDTKHIYNFEINNNDNKNKELEKYYQTFIM